jgi:hypothetical protein
LDEAAGGELYGSPAAPPKEGKRRWLKRMKKKKGKWEAGLPFIPESRSSRRCRRRGPSASEHAIEVKVKDWWESSVGV